MALITKDIDELLQPENLELTVYEAMNPTLNMLGLFDKKNNEGRKEFAFAKNETNAEKLILDGIMKEPVEIQEASQLPQVQISGISYNTGNMRRIGFEAEFTDEAISDDINYDKVALTTTMMGYSIARYLNRHAYQVLIQSAAAPTVELSEQTVTDGGWKDGNDFIDDDIKHIQRAFEDQEGFEYTLTDMYVSKDSYNVAEDYYEAVKEKDFTGVVRGMDMHKIRELNSGLLGLDQGLKPAKWYYNVYPEDNKLNDAYGSFIHINRVDKLDEIPRSVKIQMYVEYGFAVLDPNAVFFQEGI